MALSKHAAWPSACMRLSSMRSPTASERQLPWLAAITSGERMRDSSLLLCGHHDLAPAVMSARTIEGS
eukprot:6207756-Pleurochrysis_carterae.AAC.4